MIVVDCAAVVDALSGAHGSKELRTYLATQELHAPALIDFEVVSALRRLALHRQLSAARAGDLLNDYDDLPIHRWPSVSALRQRSFQLRQNISAYDAAYVVLAEALTCPLITRDARLARATGHGAEIRVL